MVYIKQKDIPADANIPLTLITPPVIPLVTILSKLEPSTSKIDESESVSKCITPPSEFLPISPINERLYCENEELTSSILTKDGFP
jgi:hypothetical protein